MAPYFEVCHSQSNNTGKREILRHSFSSLLVPDYTRCHSGGGKIANMIWHMLKDSCRVDLLEAVGTHFAMTGAQLRAMYGDIPAERFRAHNWRTDVVRIGRVPAEYVAEVSEGTYCEAIDVEVSKVLYDGYDLILSIGQVVPHEVVGMANHSKNIFVGCGGPPDPRLRRRAILHHLLRRKADAAGDRGRPLQLYAL